MNLSRALTSSILLLAMRSAAVAQRPNVSANASTRTKSGKTAPAGTRKPAARNSELSVTVYVEDSIGDSTLAPIRMLAQGIASGMFATADVHINWRTGQPKASKPERPILIEFTSLTPKTLHPGALAYAYVYEGVHIRIFYDRVRNTDRPYVTAMLLAHVMVHEITHILEGVNRHSEEGVMKARWTPNDLVDMEYKPLPFDPLDVLLIGKGLANRGHASRKEPPGPIPATRPDAGISGWPILIQERDVALKVLPEAFAKDPGRMLRFQREAEVLASLNHPNIGHIYGVEERALVMEPVPSKLTETSPAFANLSG